jgi:hypothetical protein
MKNVFKLTTLFLMSLAFTQSAVMLRSQTLVLPDAPAAAHPQLFVHPGCLHTLADLDRIKRSGWIPK